MKKCLTTIAILIIVSLLSALQWPDQNSLVSLSAFNEEHSVDDFLVTVMTDEAVYYEYEPIEITVTIYNQSEETLSFIFPCQPFISYRINDIFDYMYDYVEYVQPVMQVVQIEPGEEESWTIVHQSDWFFLSQGTYNIYGVTGFDYDFCFYWVTDPVSIVVLSLSIEEVPVNHCQKDSMLIRNHPNPFNPETVIAFDLPRDMNEVRLSIYNVKGELIRTLIDSSSLAEGEHRVIWDGRTDSGREAASGVYMTRLATSCSIASGKMMLMK